MRQNMCRNYLLVIVAAAVIPLLAAPESAHADEPRLRTLKHDARSGEWVEVPPPGSGTAEGDLHTIRQTIKDGSLRKALRQARRFIKLRGPEEPLYPTALLLEADILVAQREYSAAERVLTKFFNEFSGISQTTDALRTKFVIAEAYLAGAKRRVWGIFFLSGEDEALQMLDEISSDYPNELVAELAIKTKADHFYRTGEHELAEIEYARLLRDYPRSRYHQYSLRRAAESALASFAGVDYDDAPLVEAGQRFGDYRMRYADAADREGVGLVLNTIRETRAEKLVLVGAYYERTDHLGSAIFYYRAAIEQYPATRAEADARNRLDLLGFSDVVGAPPAPTEQQ